MTHDFTWYRLHMTLSDLFLWLVDKYYIKMSINGCILINFTSASLSMLIVVSSLGHCRVSSCCLEDQCKADREKVIIGSVMSEGRTINWGTWKIKTRLGGAKLGPVNACRPEWFLFASRRIFRFWPPPSSRRSSAWLLNLLSYTCRESRHTGWWSVGRGRGEAHMA